MPDPTPCRHCGEILQAPVMFCPFCGQAQASAAAAPAAAPPARPEPAPSGPPPKAPVPDAARWPIVPPVAPEPVVPPRTLRARLFPARAVPLPTRRPRPPRMPATRAARAEALRKLLLAALILACAGVLWHHLTAVPQGTLLVHLTRSVEGTVLVDGVPAGSPERPIPLAPGRHAVGFAAPGWSTSPITIALRDGSARTVSLTPMPHRAVLGLDSVPPGAMLSLNGRRIGHAPATLSLPPGSYRLGADLSGFAADEQRVTLGPGERRSLVLALQPVPARTLRLLAPAGSWSDAVSLPSRSRFTLLFRGRIRVRAGNQVLLLDGGDPVGLGRLDTGALSFTAVGDDPVPVVLLVHGVGAPG